VKQKPEVAAAAADFILGEMFC